MTRETKIGLLVGLAFIIVIGILLSDYNRLDPQNAPLAGVGNDVLKSTAAPNAEPSHRDVVVVTRAPSPRHTVPTVNDVTPQNNVPDEVVVQPFHGQGYPAGRSSDANGRNNVVVEAGGPESDSTTASVGMTGSLSDIQKVAHDHGVEVVSIPSGGNKPATPATPAAPINGKQYTAQPGDTLSKLAGRFMGANTKANRDAIQRANPSLQKDPNNVIVGRVYVIPSTSGASASASPAGSPVVPTAINKQPAPVAVAPVNQPATTPTHWYTVKENDSLWRIAQDQLGDGNAVAAIKELNKDVLKGRDDLRPNMRLRLPAKPLASAN